MANLIYEIMEYPHYKLYKWTGSGLKKVNNKIYTTKEEVEKACSKPGIQYIIAFYTEPYKSTIELCKFSSHS